MKSILLVFTFLFSLTATAQIHNPDKRPELLAGSTVTIRKFYAGYESGYRGFYAEKNNLKPYKGSRNVKPEELEGRKFRVLAVEPYTVKGFEKDNRWVTLEDTATKEVVYYEYKIGRSPLEYYFIVEGGLKVPEDFFCDYVRNSNGDSGTYYKLTTPDNVVVTSGFKNGQLYRFEMQLYAGKMPAHGEEGSLFITMADGTRMEIKEAYVIIFERTKYVIANNVAEVHFRQLAQSKPVKIEFKNAYTQLLHGDILSGGLRCILAKLAN